MSFDFTQDIIPNPEETLSLPEMLEIWQQTLNWQPSIVQQQQLQRLYDLILAGNQQLNLTRITAPIEFWEKHLWDSLRGIAPLLPENQDLPQTAIDIGTGGGFPGLPVAIACPNWNVTLLDSTQKKVAFLQSLPPQLEINNIKTLTARAEATGQQPQYRQSFDIALVRAVAVASVCAEYALPLLKQGGVAILYRGEWTEEETEALKPIVETLGGNIQSVDNFTTPISNSSRTCLYLKKVAPTPAKFPRTVGVPTQKPL